LLADELVRVAKGEILSDDWSRRIYSVDASHYEMEPAAVACPNDAHDVQEIMRYSFLAKIPVTGRGSGTGLLGQALSENGLVLDFSKHMNRIIEMSDNYVVIQPGIVNAVLQRVEKEKQVLAAGSCQQQLLHNRRHDSKQFEWRALLGLWQHNRLRRGS
jgi:glycolate oxidase